MPPHICVQTSEQPLARLRGEWEIVVDGERWFGPDSLYACLEALPWLRASVNHVTADAN
jgi:hypothetical protein